MIPLLLSAAVVLAIIVFAAVMVFIDRAAPAEEPAGPPQTVREDSHVLDDGGDGAVTVVEFLDFECEACGAVYPYVEDLREQYAGEITYVVRYFPLPGHYNSTNAAVAAEAAARQGKFEEMYHALFQSQSEWGEAGESRAELFRSFAEQIGLDMAAYDRDVADPETTARVKADLAEGQALGVSRTPTFFINDKPVDLRNWADVTGAIDAELAQ
ncbi:DsbA family protein [Microbacterium sp. DT81.1]|uniref:DsbA family protein n=1 Tax=Microbacterium sp. DT81.1 TaxID=3393413 RepID=UPI003CE7EAA1